MNSVASRLVACEYDKHAATMLAIFNDAILHSTALYDYDARPFEQMRSWFETKRRGDFPVIGSETETGDLAGFASYGPFRAWPAYKYSVEHSVYVDRRFRGRGIGKRLLEAIVGAAREQEYHVLIGGIDANNTVSIRMHEQLGFVPCGILRQVGFKFGRWLDLAFYQLILPTPVEPNERIK
jgi:L-amino acid N-acyltransferase YncA